MSNLLPPAPINAPIGSFAWQDWQNKLRTYVAIQGVQWSAVDKTGSNLTDIVTRTHNTLQSMQGGTTSEYYHLTNAEHSKITYIMNVTSDIQTQLNTKAPIDSPAFTTKVGFNGTAAITKPTVSGSRGGNAALASLLTALANYGLITDSTTA